jgi:hypothetical protein
VKRIVIAVAAVLTILLAACSSDQGGASAEASVAASAAESETPESVAASPSAEASEFALPSGSEFAIPSFDINGDPELAGRFPDTVGGEPLTVQSFRGDIFAEVGGADPSLQEFLDGVGADLEDVSVAFGGITTSAESFFSVGAFRVVGASEDDLEREFLAASEEAGDISGVSDGTVGGKDVKVASDPTGEAGGQVYLYTQDDTLYFITGSEELAAEVLEALP